MSHIPPPIAILFTLALCQVAVAQQFPTRPVHIIVAQPPGGTVDTTARILAKDLTERWKQPVIVENKPGAGGNIGSDYVAKAPKDGYTLMISPAAQHTINPWLYSSLGFDPMRSFAPVAMIGSTPMVLMVRPSLPANGVAEYLALARAKPNGITYSSAGNGTYNHLAGESIANAGNVRLAHLPYKGVAPALADVVGGHVDSTIGTIPSSQGYINQGTLRGLAVTTSKRSKALPNIPTLAEAGLPGVDIAVRVGMVAPAGTPASVLLKINADVGAALQTREVAAALEKQGLEIEFTSAEKLGEILQEEAASWGRTIKQSGLKLE